MFPVRSYTVLRTLVNCFLQIVIINSLCSLFIPLYSLFGLLSLSSVFIPLNQHIPVLIKLVLTKSIHLFLPFLTFFLPLASCYVSFLLTIPLAKGFFLWHLSKVRSLDPCSFCPDFLSQASHLLLASTPIPVYVTPQSKSALWPLSSPCPASPSSSSVFSFSCSSITSVDLKMKLRILIQSSFFLIYVYQQLPLLTLKLQASLNSQCVASCIYPFPFPLSLPQANFLIADYNFCNMFPVIFQTI